MRRVGALLGLMFFANPALAALPSADVSGWFRWQVDNAAATVIWVRLDGGRVEQLRTGHTRDCRSQPRSATDLGLVSQSENFRWFRRLVEARDTPARARRAALIGVASTGSAAALDYLEALIGDPSTPAAR